MAYRITADEQREARRHEGIVIGARRWDKLPGGDWLPGPQSPLTLPKAYWTARARNAYFTAPDEITFYDPTFPGWFRVRFDPKTGRLLDAADDRHRALHAPPLLGLRPAGLDLAAALAVALRLALDQLEEARRVLERGEARRARRAGGGSGRRRRAAAIVPAAPTSPPSAKERSAALARGEAPLLVVHATILRCGSRRSATCSST